MQKQIQSIILSKYDYSDFEKKEIQSLALSAMAKTKCSMAKHSYISSYTSYQCNDTTRVVHFTWIIDDTGDSVVQGIKY
ncbi:hypothetical protein DFA_06805 [Cavenderia fasciculata]|uniref:Uncharacterized protein n=1 Tax=Cavenderia fasciculata TaxID=261658 RepID=F4Q2B8_CACFS|nr:uncharacterized protein DFA_06805 [Cavenderia fasciculata]EGG18138.1 hypothetical protein DFA_06805 [Cavenderia fasciculata]|eukprot:XP_004366179.1 hypothetical protein DFA_06805 [Cavenderia fasciculata]